VVNRQGAHVEIDVGPSQRANLAKPQACEAGKCARQRSDVPA